jgi:hypothetical protein
MSNLNKAQFIFAKNVTKLISSIFDEGYQCSMGEVLRTREQAELYAKQGKGIADSLHCYKLAIDINLFKNGAYLTDYESYKRFGEYWCQLNELNRWGGNFTHLVDSNHFEMNAKRGV